MGTKRSTDRRDDAATGSRFFRRLLPPRGTSKGATPGGARGLSPGWKATRSLLGWVMVLFLGAGGVLGAAALARGEESRVVLDADRVTYDEAGYRTTAEGDVRIRYENLFLWSPWADMDTSTQILRAQGSPGSPVVLRWQGRRLEGDRLEYNLQTREGVLRNPRGQVDALLLRGGTLEVVPLEKAVERRWVTARQAKNASGDEDLVQWDQVTITTCRETHPHYRLVAKRVVVFPGRKVVVRSPQVYLGEYNLFTYPFDYVVLLGEKRKEVLANFLPSMAGDGSRGFGVGLEGPIAWDTGTLRVGAMYWSRTGGEGSLRLDQKIGKDLAIYATSAYTYDDVDEDKTWRTSWGLRYRAGGWKMVVGWSQREEVSVEKRAGLTYRGLLWRDPEVSLTGPWWADPATGGWWRLLGSWGTYDEEGLRTTRTGMGLEIYGSGPDRQGFRVFWKGLHWRYRYDRPTFDDEGREEDEQRITEGVVGFDWPLGPLSMRTAYVRRWVDGASPMAWDGGVEREDLYQKVRVSLGEGWSVSARGAFDLQESELREMVYQVGLDQDCLRWELTYRDDLQGGNDDWAGLRILVTAYPNSPLWVGQKDLADPADPPEDLPGSESEGGEP